MEATMSGFVFDSRRYPRTPGVYLMRGKSGKILYVGKAKSLRDRLASYFQGTPEVGRIRRLVANVARVEVILVGTEAESLVLEDTLIKRHQPSYNRARRSEEDGYYYIGQTDETWPRLVPFRKHRINKRLGEAPPARTYGPYVSRNYRDVLLRLTSERFGIRSCDALPNRACFLHELERCLAPCVQHVPPAAYRVALRRAGAFLRQRPDAVMAELRREMAAQAARLEFERAKWTRDVLQALDGALAKQVVERPGGRTQDVLWFGAERALVLKVERGAVVALESHALSGRTPEQFLVSHYAQPMVDELLVPRGVTARVGGLRPKHPTRGPEAQLLRLCELNYRYREEHNAW
jgi:excinuclease ABC subunit C